MTRYYSQDHEWIEVEDDIAIIGVTDYAQEQLGDVVFVELPETGREVVAGADVAVVESVKAASEVYAPLTGTITETNDALADDPSLVNSDPEGEGWFFKLRLEDAEELDGLLNEAAYQAFVATL